LLRNAALGRALKRLAGRVSDRDMRALNAAVDLDHRDVKEVVARFLQTIPR
jgi:glycine betaine/choline ABC-type transport system substrate-binding protein